MPAGPAKLARFAHTPRTRVLARLGLAHRPPGRWLRGRFAWTHCRGNRSGAASRSAQDSTTLPTAGQLAFRDGDPPSAPGVLAPAHHLGGRSDHPNDPPHSREVRRWRPAWRASGGWHAAGRATEQSLPDKPHHDYELTALRPNSREIVDAQRRRRRPISRTPTPCAQKMAISSRSANDR